MSGAGKSFYGDYVAKKLKEKNLKIKEFLWVDLLNIIVRRVYRTKVHSEDCLVSSVC